MFRLTIYGLCVTAAIADDFTEQQQHSLYPECGMINFDSHENFVKLHEAPQPPHGVSKDHYIGGKFAMFENTTVSGGATIYYMQNAQGGLSRVSLFYPTMIHSPQNLPVRDYGTSTWFPGYDVSEIFCANFEQNTIHHLGLVFYKPDALLAKSFESLTTAVMFYAFPATYTRKDTRISHESSTHTRPSQLELRVDESWMGVDKDFANPPGLYGIDFTPPNNGRFYSRDLPTPVADSQLVQLGTKIGFLSEVEM